MAVNKTTDVGAGIPQFFDKKLLRFTTDLLSLIPFAQKRPLPMGEGKTVEFTRYLPLADPGIGRLLTEGAPGSSQAFTLQEVTDTILEYGAWVQPTSLLKKTMIDRLNGLTEVLAEDAAVTLDKIAHRKVCSDGCYCLPVDMHVDTSFEGTVTTATSTTSIADTKIDDDAIGDAADELNQAIITFKTGLNKGESRAITDYNQTGGVMTLAPALTNATTIGDEYHVASPHKITSSETFGGNSGAYGWPAILRARTILTKYRARRYPGNYFVALVDPDSVEGLMQMTQWVNVNTYRDAVKGIFTGEVGKIGGFRFVENTNPFWFPVHSTPQNATDIGPGESGDNQEDANAATSTGTVLSNLFFGMDAFGATTFADQMGKVKSGIMKLKNPGPNDTSNPLDMYSTAGWKMEACYTPLNALHMVNIWSYRDGA